VEEPVLARRIPEIMSIEPPASAEQIDALVSALAVLDEQHHQPL
jgi:hypothetical protein